MNRRSMIKNTALGASATLIAGGKATAQTVAKVEEVALVGNDNKRIKTSGGVENRLYVDAHITNEAGIDKIIHPVKVTSFPQEWEYTTGDQDGLKNKGEHNWEAVGIFPNGTILFKRPKSE